MNTKLISVWFNQVVNSLIFKNRLEFLSINETQSFDLNLNALSIMLVFEKVTLKLVDRNVFDSLEFFTLNGLVLCIDSDFFKHFRKIKHFTIFLENLKYFFHIGTKWMTNLNYNISDDLKDENIKKKIHLSLNFAINEQILFKVF